jgi:hypothetical protein
MTLLRFADGQYHLLMLPIIVSPFHTVRNFAFLFLIIAGGSEGTPYKSVWVLSMD